MTSHLNHLVEHQETLKQHSDASDTKPNAPENTPLPAETKFDKAVYGGISYFAQAGTGILLTHWLRHASGRPIFNKIAEWAGPRFMEKISSKRGAEAVKEMDHWIVVSTMIMVGNAFLLPVKWLENRKPQIIRSMTERANAKREASGEVISEDEHHQQHQRLDQLEKEPKQNWASLLGGRAFGLAAVYATVYGVGQKNNEIMERLTAKTFADVAHAVGAEKLANSKTFENYLRIGFNDMFYSTVSAGGLYAYSHFLRPPKKDKAAAKIDEPEALSEVVEAALDDTPKHSHAKTWTDKHKPVARTSVPAHPSTYTERAETVQSAEHSLAI